MGPEKQHDGKPEPTEDPIAILTEALEKAKGAKIKPHADKKQVAEAVLDRIETNPGDLERLATSGTYEELRARMVNLEMYLVTLTRDLHQEPLPQLDEQIAKLPKNFQILDRFSGLSKTEMEDHTQFNQSL